MWNVQWQFIASASRCLFIGKQRAEQRDGWICSNCRVIAYFRAPGWFFFLLLLIRHYKTKREAVILLWGMLLNTGICTAVGGHQLSTQRISSPLSSWAPNTAHYSLETESLVRAPPPPAPQSKVSFELGWFFLIFVITWPKKRKKKYNLVLLCVIWLVCCDWAS